MELLNYHHLWRFFFYTPHGNEEGVWLRLHLFVTTESRIHTNPISDKSTPPPVAIVVVIVVIVFDVDDGVPTTIYKEANLSRCVITMWTVGVVGTINGDQDDSINKWDCQRCFWIRWEEQNPSTNGRWWYWRRWWYPITHRWRWCWWWYPKTPKATSCRWFSNSVPVPKFGILLASWTMGTNQSYSGPSSTYHLWEGI